MSAPEPRIRALQTQHLLRSVERLPAAERDAVRALVGRESLEAVDAALPVAWHPMSLHMSLSDALRDVVGPERNVRIWSETMAATFERPLLRGFVEMSTSLFGVTPHSLLRRVELIYAQITRDLGSLRFDPGGDRECDVTLTGFPADRYRFECYVEGLQGCIAASLPLAQARGEVTVAARNPARGEARYRVVWITGTAATPG